MTNGTHEPWPTVDGADPADLSGFRLSLPPESTSIAIARAVIRRTFRFADSDAESRFLTAFTDLMLNAIDEHQRLDSVDPIVVTGDFGSEPGVAVADAGSGYSPPATTDDQSEPSSGTAATPKPRGRGVEIATALVPGIRFDTSGGGTVVTIPLGNLGVVR